jgi:hypothetical protein
MNEQSGPEPRLDARNPDAVDDSGTQYLKSLCDRRDAAVLNPFLSGEAPSETQGAGDTAATATAAPTPAS